MYLPNERTVPLNGDHIEITRIRSRQNNIFQTLDCDIKRTAAKLLGTNERAGLNVQLTRETQSRAPHIERAIPGADPVPNTIQTTPRSRVEVAAQSLVTSSHAQNASKDTFQVPGEGDVECVICRECIGDFILVPCGHADMCKSCARKFVDGDCPFCKRRVEMAIKIFKPGQSD